MSPSDDTALAAIRAMIDREIARVGDPVTGVPGGDPSDTDGWHSWTSDRVQPADEPGRPYFEPEAWRWFRLIDLAWLDDRIVIAFAWDEPGTPALRYLTFAVVADRYAASPPLVTSVVRAHLRSLLAPHDVVRTSPTATTPPGWRHRVTRTWLGPDTVVVRAPAHPDNPAAAERQAHLDAAWDAGEPCNPGRRGT